MEEYDDNIFLSRDNKVGDFITRFLPSLTMDYKSSLWDWKADYMLDLWYYAGRGRTRDSHTLNLTSETRVINNFFLIDVSDSYASVVLDPRKPWTDQNLDVNRTDANNLVLSPFIRYKVNPAVTLSTGYRYTNLWYREQGIDREMHTGFADLDYAFSPRLKCTASLEYTADSPAEGPSDNQSRAFVKVAYLISEKTDAEVGLGYQRVDFSFGRDWDGPYYNVRLTYRPFASSKVEFTASSVITPTPLLGIMESRTEQLSFQYGEIFAVSGAVYHKRDEYLETDLKDDTTGATATAAYITSPRVTLNISGKYEQEQFSPGAGERKDYSVSGNVSYRLTSKSTLTVGYSHSGESVQDLSGGFNDNIISVQIKMTF